MTNAEKFKQLFGIYATELWAMPEEEFLAWLNAEVKTEDWIPVAEKLPEKNDFVLVTISGTASEGKSWKRTMTLAV